MHQIHNGDCAEVMASMEDNSVDAIVTDPPYGLAFMGVAWDTFNDGRKAGSRTMRLLTKLAAIIILLALQTKREHANLKTRSSKSA